MLVDLIKNQGMFSFVQHYLGWEGGMKGKRPMEENVQRVTRLLYQVDHRLKDLTRLWHEEDVHAIRKHFFEGNRRLNKTRVPSTLKAHIHAWKLVLHFSGNPGMDISAHVVLTNRT